ncbi:protein FAM83F [Trichomycterus rosablanca]|uniref:protein FAM83F n=1 Tax=Trichomycterus rosablanca TaxID=2290929 RepID=UPI002F351C8A
MADSQVICMDEEHVNVKIPESKPEFYYSEEQRAALEHLLRHGDGAFKLRLREDNIKDFLSAREVRCIRDSFQEYDDHENEGETEQCGPRSPRDSDSGVHSTYFPTVSDTEAPPLELGWPKGGFYRGVTRVSVYTHPPKDNSPHIKEVVRRLIQESSKTVAVVMDLLTDLLILQDLLDAASKRCVAVYLLLDDKGLPHFLDMCSRLQISAQHLRNMRVRTVKGCGLALSFGKLPGSMCSKYMLVDGEKVMFGSYSFTWTSSRINRSTITVMSGHVVDFFDNDFRELYAVSEKVDLYHEFHITKPTMSRPTSVLKSPPTTQATQPALPVAASRFQVSLGESKQVNLNVPAHKYHNPKYALVVGNSLGITGSLQDLSKLRDYAGNDIKSNMEKLLHTDKGADEPDRASPEATDENKKDVKNASPFGSKKQRSSFRLFLKGRSPNNSPDLKTVSQNHSSDTKQANHSPPKPANHVKDTKLANHTNEPPKVENHVREAQPESPQIQNSIHAPPSPVHKVSDSETGAELDDSFVIIEKPNVTKFKTKNSSKLPQRSVSMQVINTGQEDGLKGRRRSQKKNCIQS